MKPFNHLTKRSSFTLIEILVVISLIAILLAVVSPRLLRHSNYMRVSAAAEQIKEHIRLAQERARMGHSKYMVAFDTTAETYGVTRGALSFDGVNDYVDAGNDVTINPQHITLEFWAYLNTVGTRPHIVGKGGGSTGAYYIVVETSGEVRFYFDIGTGWQLAGSGAWRITTGKWYHFTATYNGTVAKLYVDAIERGSNTISGTLRTTDLYNLTIGKGYGGTVGPVNGTIDEVRIYNRALNVNEIIYSYQTKRPRSTSGLVGWWRFDETGTTAIDSSAQVNNGTIFGATLAYIKDPISGRQLFKDLTTDPTLKGVTIDTANFDVGVVVKSYIIFDSLGQPENPGSVTISAGGESKTIIVEPVTGKVRVE